MTDATRALLVELTQPGRLEEGRNGTGARSCGQCAAWRWATLRTTSVLAAVLAFLLAMAVYSHATPATPLLAPTDLTAVAGDRQVTLSWTPGPDGGNPVTKHQYRRKRASSGYGDWEDIPDSAPGGANATGYTVTGLTNGATYTLQVQAVNALGDGAASDEVAATPAAPLPTTVALVSNFAEQERSLEMLFDIAQAFTTGSEAAGYILTSVDLQIYGTAGMSAYSVSVHADSSERPGASLGTLTNPASLPDGTAQFVASGVGIRLDPGTTYWLMMDLSVGHEGSYLHFSRSGSEDSGSAAGWMIADGKLSRAPSAADWLYDGADPLKIAVHGHVALATLPEAPDGLKLVTGNQEITARWSAPADDGDSPITGYWVEWGLADGTEAWTGEDLTGDPAGGPPPTSHTINGLQNGKEYIVRVQAINAVGGGEWAEAQTVAGRSGLYGRIAGSVLPRFGLDVLDGAIGAVAGRVAVLDPEGAAPGPASFTLAGHAATPSAARAAPGWTAAGSIWAAPEPDGGRAVDLLEALGRSAFTAGTGEAGPAVWGEGSYRSLSDAAEGLSWQGDLFGLRIGADGRPHRQWLAGLALSWSEGRFGWSAENDATGRLDLTLGGVWPYAGWVSADGGWRLWGLAGYGSGSATLVDDGIMDPGESGLSMVGVALGAGHDLWRGGGSGAVTALRGKAELSFARLDLDGNAEDGGLLEAVTVDTRRVRIGLEASHGRGLAAGRRLELSLSVGGRGDFVDGGGAALEVGPGLRYVDPSLGLVLEGRGHVLAASSGGAGEWGLGLAASFDPRIRGRGLAMGFDAGLGASGGGAFGLWEREVAVASPDGGSAAEPRLEARMEYGLAVPQGLLAPYLGFAMSGAGERRYRLGVRREIGTLVIGLQGERVEADGPAENRITLEGRIGF